jgi:hypothetical protein
MTLTPTEKLELAKQLIDVLDRYIAEKKAQPSPDVLLLAFYAATDRGARDCLLDSGLK